MKTRIMIWIPAFILLAVAVASAAIFLVWRHPGHRTVSEQVAETGLVMVVPVFGALVSFALSQQYQKNATALDSDQMAISGGAAGGASSALT